MIRLAPRPCPPELTAEIQALLTAKYLADNSIAVWKQDYIKRDLLLESDGKCCFCECKLGEESKYLEIEHFNPKSLYPHLVVFWTNLFSACKRCNGCKHNHDTVAEPIIHPVNDDPKDHIQYRAYRFYSKTKLGEKTIEVVDLNDRARLVTKRFEIGERMIRELDELEDMAIDFQNKKNTSTRRKNQIIRKAKVILNEALPSMEYAATAATVLINEPLFEKVKTILKVTNLWDAEMTNMETIARQIALDIF